jgi:hypothetical protein
MHATRRPQDEATARTEPRAIPDWPHDTSIYRMSIYRMSRDS